MSLKKQPVTAQDKIRCERLKELFFELKEREKELTQKSFAGDCKITPSAFSRILSGDLAISHESALLFARRLGCHPGEFHDDFVDFTAHQSFELVKSFHQFEALAESDRETVRRVIDSLTAQNRKDDK